jgi:tetratricopeptide (TPR) repeat protein
MILLRSIGFAVALSACTALVSAQQQSTGTIDYVLGNSSVMWIPRSSSIFLNPGELARLHQNEFLVSSGRFKSLASMSGAIFVPGTGTFGLGVAPLVNSTQYSVGFGRLIGDYNTAGGAVSVIPSAERSVRLSFGVSIHLPTGGQETGAHAALSVTNVLSKAVVNVGGAYWLIPSTVRLQLATQTRVERAEFLGVEVRALERVHVQVGTRGFKKILAGASYTTSYAILEFGAGPEGVSFTMNVRVGDAASDTHDEAYSQGDEAYVDQQYGDAREHFLKALQYNEYDGATRIMAEKSRHMLDSSVTALLQQANENEGQLNFTEAMRAYAQILRIDPQQTMAASNLANVEKKLKLYVQQLLISGDSLKNLHEVTRARKSYELALELDPENDSASVRIDALENLSKENVLSLLSKARSLLRKSQLDEAQKEFERILSTDPNNSQARSGIRTINTRRINDQLIRGKSAYDTQRFIEALQIFSDIVQKDKNNREASQFLERTRDVLKSDVDRLFKTGLQFYIKEDFKSAIAAWDKVLMIQPEDNSTLEYRKRAEEKLKALEQFK